MQCSEFREVSNSYLSDELLVETNLRVHRHLENCAECREDLAARRRLRKHLGTAVKRAAAFQIDPAFDNKLYADLNEAASMHRSWIRLAFSPKCLLPVMAALLVVVAVGIVYVRENPDTEVLNGQNSLSRVLTEIAHTAIGNHKDCTLEKMGLWDSLAATDYAEKTVYTEKVLEPIKANFSNDVRMLSVHNCTYRGTRFKHVVLRDGPNIVSVFFADGDQVIEPDDPSADTILSEVHDGLQVATFYNRAETVLVVSDLTEIKNLTFARTLLNAWKQV